jgi:hypothetical protein
MVALGEISGRLPLPVTLRTDPRWARRLLRYGRPVASDESGLRKSEVPCPGRVCRDSLLDLIRRPGGLLPA